MYLYFRVLNGKKININNYINFLKREKKMYLSLVNKTAATIYYSKSFNEIFKHRKYIKHKLNEINWNNMT